MISRFISQEYLGLVTFAGILLSYVLTSVLLRKFAEKLPKDGGREHAVNGELSKGKPRGAGVVFIPVFAVCALLFIPCKLEGIIYILLTIFAMITGFLDDCSEKPWNEYKKGLLDLIIALGTAVTYVVFNGSTLAFAVFQTSVELPMPLYIVLATILVWVSINVTNCADGIDGLSATLAIITLICFYFSASSTFLGGEYRLMILFLVACLLGYLWFNANPSILMMGDAGSRAMGFFIAIIALKSKCVLLYIPFAIVLILDGGLGLIKVSLKRFLKIKLMENIRTPLHDHVRKNKKWEGPQTVFRFAIIQIVIGFATIYLLNTL